MFEGLRNRRKRLLLESTNLDIELATSRQLQSIVTREAVSPMTSRKPLEDTDEADWTLLGADEKKLDEEESRTLREQAQKFYYRNPHGRNIIRLVVKYVVGRGFDITPQSDWPEIKEIWKAFWKANKMDQRKREIVRRCMRDGEVFIRWSITSMVQIGSI